MHACADVCAVYYVLRRHICRCAHGDLYGHACMCVADLTRSPGRPASAWVACAMPCAHCSSTGSLLPHTNNTSSTGQTPAAAAAQPRRSVCLSLSLSLSLCLSIHGGRQQQAGAVRHKRASESGAAVPRHERRACSYTFNAKPTGYCIPVSPCCIISPDGCPTALYRIK